MSYLDLPINKIIGEIISELRKDNGLTQKQLAQAFHISEGTIAHYEQGVTIPNTEIICKFADYFHVPTDYILGKCRCRMEYSKLNTKLHHEMTLGDMINIVSGLSKEKRAYLYQTIKLLNSVNQSK